MRETIVERVSIQDVCLVIILALLIMSGSVLTAAGQSRALSLADVLIALRSKKADAAEKNKLLAEAVKQRGITFSLTPEIEKELDSTGAGPDLIAVIRVKAIPTPVPNESAKSDAKPAEVKPVEDFSFFRNRASAEMASGDNVLAIADLEKAIGLKPDDAGVRHDRAMLLSSSGRFADAAEEYTKAIELAPTDARNFAGRAAALEKLDKPIDALKDYQKVITLVPADQAAASAVIRITSEMTKSAVAAAAKPASDVNNSTVEPSTAKPGVTSPATNISPVNESASTSASNAEPAVENAGNLGTFCTDAVKPKYPAQAMSMRAEGEVLVRVGLDENGKVLEAKASNGHPALRAAAESAVKMSKFRPVTRNGKPVKATGFMTYRFVL
jgi:TonB family protein